MLIDEDVRSSRYKEYSQQVETFAEQQEIETQPTLVAAL